MKLTERCVSIYFCLELISEQSFNYYLFYPVLCKIPTHSAEPDSLFCSDIFIPFFLNSGGKGVAAFIGMMLVLLPLETLIRPNIIKERGGIFGRALLHLMVKYFGKWSISLIALPVAFYYMTVMPGVRKNEMKYWSAIYPGCSKIKYLICIYKHYVMFGKTLIARITAG